LAQTIGSNTASAIQDNLDKALKFMEQAANSEVNVIVFPESYMGGDVPQSIS
jgi:predicted amidohydrolase